MLVSTSDSNLALVASFDKNLSKSLLACTVIVIFWPIHGGNVIHYVCNEVDHLVFDHQVSVGKMSPSSMSPSPPPMSSELLQQRALQNQLRLKAKEMIKENGFWSNSRLKNFVQCFHDSLILNNFFKLICDSLKAGSDLRGSSCITSQWSVLPTHQGNALRRKAWLVSMP